MQNRSAHVIVVLVSLCVLAASGLNAEAGSAPVVDTVIRIDKNSAAGNPDGLSWETAYPDFQAGVDAAAASSVDEVWVAAGRYQGLFPIKIDDEPRAVFRMRDNVSVYGGFEGSESSREERDWEKHLTILDGVPTSLPSSDELIDLAEDHPYYKVFGWYTLLGADNTTIDGLELTVNWPDQDSYPGYDRQLIVSGLKLQSCAATVRNCRFSLFFQEGHTMDNTLPGLRADDSVVLLSKCIFEGPTLEIRESTLHMTDTVVSREARGFVRDSWGIHGSQMTATQCLIEKVSYIGDNSQAIFSRSKILNEMEMYEVASCELVNCVLSDFGSLRCETTGAVSLTNCSISGVELLEGVAVLTGNSTPVSLRNCIFWSEGPNPEISGENVTVSYSNIRGGYEGEGNISADPLFVDAENGDFRLRRGSPCIDSGTSEGAPETDIDGLPRPLGDGVDMGAYESPGPDVNHDGAVNAIDVQLVINAALGLTTGYDSDVDNNGNVDAVDIQLVINATLGVA